MIADSEIQELPPSPRHPKTGFRWSRLYWGCLAVIPFFLTIWAAFAHYYAAHSPVYLLNGLDVPYVLTLNSIDYELLPGDPMLVELSEGRWSTLIHGSGINTTSSTLNAETPFWTR